MSNAKQKEKAPWKLLLFFFSLSIIRGSLTQFYLRKLFSKCLCFQIDGFFFIPIYIYRSVAEFAQMLHFDWSGLEMFVKILLMEQKCVGSTLKLFLSKKKITLLQKLPMYNINQMDFWS